MTIQKLIERLQTHEDQQRDLEIEICINGGGVYYQPVDIEFTLDGDVYLTTAELGNHEAVRVLPQSK